LKGSQPGIAAENPGVATPNHSGHVPQQCANLFLGGKQKIGIVLTWRTNPKPRRKPARSSFR
jgi:hypothetical protein